MRLSRQIRNRISLVMLSIGMMGWIVLLTNPGHLLTIQHCPVTVSGPSRTSLHMLLAMNPVSALLTGWTWMVAAMMFPILIMPVRYICRRSIKRRRFPSSLFFVSGYIGVWVVTGFFVIAVVLSVNLLMPKSWLPAIGTGILALIWQFSPARQRCLNRGHDHSSLAAFGWGASRDALLFGVTHGGWCVGSGWALMLFPMLLPSGHNLAMIFATYIMTSDHLEHPRPPRWRIHVSKKLLRIAVAQIHMRLTPAPKVIIRVTDMKSAVQAIEMITE